MMRSGRFAGLRAPVLLIILTIGATCASAAWRLPSVISDNMVLQCDIPVALWGWSDPGDKVTVQFAGQTTTAVADKAGKWMVKLDALKAGGPDHKGECR